MATVEVWSLRERPAYWFLLVGGRPYQSSALWQKLEQDLETFELELEGNAQVIRPFPERAAAIRQEVVEGKTWDDALRIQMREATDPFLLVIDVEWLVFDPQIDRWAILWLSAYPPEELYRVFATLAAKVLSLAYVGHPLRQLEQEERRLEVEFEILQNEQEELERGDSANNPQDAQRRLALSGEFERIEDSRNRLKQQREDMERDLAASEDNLFGYLGAIARRTATKKWLRYFEIRPSIFGVTLDVNAILNDIVSG